MTTDQSKVTFNQTRYIGTEIFFLFLIFAGALFNVALLNAGGLNLRLPTVAILVFMLYKSTRLTLPLTFFFQHSTITLVFCLYMFLLLPPLLWAVAPVLIIKQWALLIILALNIFFFLMIRTTPEYFSEKVLWVFLSTAMITNMYGLFLPFWSLYQGGFSSAMLRPSGFFNQESTNVFGQLQVMMLSYIAGILLSDSVARRLKSFALVSFGVLLPVFILANNRASFLAVFVQLILLSTICYNMVRTKMRKIYTFVVSAVVVTIALTPLTVYLPSFSGPDKTFYDNIIERAGSLFGDESGNFGGEIQVRIDGFNNAVRQFESSPLLGVGLANNALDGPLPDLSAGETYASTVRQSSENMYVDIFSDTGILGILSFITFYGYIIWQAFVNMRFTRNTKAFPLALGSFLAICGMFVNGLSVSPLTQHFFWINVGLVFYLWKYRRAIK